jgi:predicted ATP-dependent endonuclease of OLD family
MRLIKARVRSFQSFSDTGELEFTEGINLLIGQNNAGKSALLRALLPAIPDDRHRTPEKWEQFRLPVPEISLTVDVSGTEIRDWILRSNKAQHFPVTMDQNQDVNRFMDEIFQRASLPIRVTRTPSLGFSAPYPSHQIFVLTPGQKCSAFLVPTNGDLAIQPVRGSAEDALPGLLWDAWRRELFYFAAERMTIGQAPPGYANRLQPNAGNLPNVLHTLIGERGDVFRQLIRHLQEVFPTVGNISVRTMPENKNLEVLVWPTEEMKRVELSFSLNSSGTGVAQAIALLTAIMTIDKAVIIIDEVNSFLHPAAVKAFLRILQTRYTQHQYIISTHSPEVIGEVDPIGWTGIGGS